MSDSRVSNKQILSALNDLPAAIAAAMAATPQSATPAAPTTEGSEAKSTVNVDGAYLSHVSAKLQDRANADGNTYVLYARVNKANETKLAYCIGSKWSSLTDKRIVGAVKTVSPE